MNIRFTACIAIVLAVVVLVSTRPLNKRQWIKRQSAKARGHGRRFNTAGSIPKLPPKHTRHIIKEHGKVPFVKVDGEVKSSYGKLILTVKPYAAESSVAEVLRNEKIRHVYSGNKRKGRGDAIIVENAQQSNLEKLRSRPDLFTEIEEDTTVFSMACYAHIVDMYTRYTWGLDRIDTPSINWDNHLNIKGDGNGVDVYLLDTGIRKDHDEFTNTDGSSRVEDIYFSVFDDDGSDGHGHGTYLAGVIGGNTFGIAKKVTIISVKVMRPDGKGDTSDVLRGIEWVKNTTRSRGRKSLVNMSIGGVLSEKLNDAVLDLLDEGILPMVAAGNDYGEDACGYSPASASGVMTVGASDPYDDVGYFSNTGSCVSIYAPGMWVESAWPTSTSDTMTISGTSVATAHVTGAVAAYLSTLPVAQMTAEIVAETRSKFIAKASPVLGTKNLPLLQVVTC